VLGLITDIQRFSLNDGPGIRTTVFCKGCNMRCAWCHNPETLSGKTQLQFTPSKCIGCGRCSPGADTLKAKPEEVLTDPSGLLRHYRGDCQSGALVKIGKLVSANNVLKEAIQDRRFYENSRGGVTLSGGEITIQTEFAFETLSLLQANRLHTAIETNLSAEWERFERLLPVIDLVIFDIKCMDSVLHQAWTGIPNQTILANAKRLGARKTPIIVRTPVIPGFNAAPEAIQAIAAYIRGFKNLVYYELLAFNPLGADKYQSLRIPYGVENAPAVREETMQLLRQAAETQGIEARIA
jgi:pyruvate formate lyase activating enzyme